MTGSETIRWLFDLEVGGKPAAFMCLIINSDEVKRCGCVTRTLSGMHTHQRIVHGFTIQTKLFEEKVDAISTNAG